MAPAQTKEVPMSGFALQSFFAQINAAAARPVVKVQVRTMPRGSWRWQNAVSARLVRCPAGESPDCRRRGHELVGIVARKVAAGTRYTQGLIEMAAARAAEINIAVAA